ncbi:MAG: M50 family metallopeptidase, partial [Halobacteriales archaeon]|nr:M50 family metallopeptidase [Halobacteriales archaeon]
MTTTVRPPPRDPKQGPPAAPPARAPEPLPAGRPAPARPGAPSTVRAAPPLRAQPPIPHEGSRFGISPRELAHLAVGVVGLSLAFAFALSHPPPNAVGDIVKVPDDHQISVALGILPFAFAVVLLGFLLHEMAHKVVAQHYYMWAEFRCQVGGLCLAVGLGVLTPFILAVPGAVNIDGSPTRREAGLISAVGPMVNLVIGFLAWPFIGASPNPLEVGPNIGNFPQLVAIVNAYLAAFNMFPILPLDGSKILRWSIPVYV